MARIGKIARLPSEIREQLNRRIQDGKSGTKLVTWLNSLKKVKAVLKTEFNGRPISVQNLSEWNAGGYRDWLTEQDTIDLVHLMQDSSDKLSQTANNTRLSDLLAHRLVARIALLAQRLDQSTADGPPDPRLLTELCAAVVALRKGDHSAERLKLARDRLELDHKSNTADLEKLFPKWAEEHGYHQREVLTQEELHEKYREIFGIDAPKPNPAPLTGGDAASATMKQQDCSPPAESPFDPTQSNQ
jgi:hypothetical protein